MSNQKYNFLEANLKKGFCLNLMTQVKRLITSSTDFTILGMPGVGITIFFKFLATRDFANFIYVDSSLLKTFTKKEFFRLLLKELGDQPDNNQFLKERIEKRFKELSQHQSKNVLILNHFDKLGGELDEELFVFLRNLRNLNRKKIVFIFGATKPLVEVVPERVSTNHANTLAKILYLKPYSISDTKSIIKTIIGRNLYNQNQIAKATQYSGGHFLLMQLLLKNQHLDPLEDKIIQAKLKEIYKSLSYLKRKTLQTICSGKMVKMVDSYLIEIGLVQKAGTGYKIFTPLLTQYIRSNLRLKFTPNENKLFKLLRQNLGKVVTKDQIFNLVWGKDSDASDWALNSIIYRIKKNSVFLEKGYLIESQKKIGYILIKN